MSNEELVVLIQAGDRGRIMELWQQIQRMVCKQAGRWAGFGGTTLEDLEQAARLFCLAVKMATVEYLLTTSI